MTVTYADLSCLFEGDRRQSLERCVRKRYDWTPSQTRRAVDRYVMFLYVASQLRSACLVPTREIDCVWETDILRSTEYYSQLCQQLCGRMIHHASETEMQEIVQFPGMEITFSQTKAIFSEYFGAGALVGQMAACGVLGAREH